MLQTADRLGACLSWLSYDLEQDERNRTVQLSPLGSGSIQLTLEQSVASGNSGLTLDRYGRLILFPAWVESHIPCNTGE